MTLLENFFIPSESDISIDNGTHQWIKDLAQFTHMHGKANLAKQIQLASIVYTQHTLIVLVDQYFVIVLEKTCKKPTVNINIIFQLM